MLASKDLDQNCIPWIKIVFLGRKQLISHQEMRTALDVILFVTQRAEALDVMSGLHVTCDTYGGIFTEFWPENLKESDCLGDVAVDGRIKVGRNYKGLDTIEWIYLA